MRKNEPWKDEIWWDPACGAGVRSDEDTDARVQQLDRTPEWREDEETSHVLERLAEEIVRLGLEHPPPAPAELDDEWAWIRENWGTPILEPYRGKHVAVFNRRVIECDDDPLSLRLAWAKTLNVHPDRLAVVYVPAM